MQAPTDPADAPVLWSTRTRRIRYPARWIALCVGLVMVLLIGFVFGPRLGGPAPIKSQLIGQRAPEFDLAGLDGGRVSSSDFAGTPYVVNFWASWCVPCRAEAPHLQSFAQRWEGRVHMVGIVWNDDTDAARAFRDEFGLTYPQALDPDSRFAINYGLRGIPETYVVSADGIVMAGLIGALGPRTLDEVVEQVLGGEQVTLRNDNYRTQP